MRRLAFLIGVAALAAAPVAAGPGVLPATAHDVLIASSPEDGATVAQAPDVVELTFDNAVQDRFAQVAVLDADEQPHQDGEPDVVGATVTQALGDLPDGEYTVSYRVVSSDGHPISGTITFVVAGSGAGEPSVETPAETTPETPPGDVDTPEDTGTTSEPTSPSVDDAATDATGTAAEGGDGGPSAAVIVLVLVGAAVLVGGIAYLAVGGRGGDDTGDTGP